MMQDEQKSSPIFFTTLPKIPTGINGLDEITLGGLPQGRPTLICGSAGCGKTLFSLEFIVRGAMEYDEPGVFMAFEEKPEDLAALMWLRLDSTLTSCNRSGKYG